MMDRQWHILFTEKDSDITSEHGEFPLAINLSWYSALL